MTIAVPLVVVTIGALALAPGVGFDPVSEDLPDSPAEAAVLGDLPALVRFEQTGVDFRRAYPLRPTHTEFNARAATPLQAAVLSRRLALVRFVERAAAPIDAAEREAAICLAADLRATDIMEHLRGGGALPSCAAGAALRDLQQPR